MMVYRRIDDHKERCSLGEDHIVTVWAGKAIEETGETWQYDPGYGKQNIMTDTGSIMRQTQ